MAKREDIKSILVIGAGPIIIGQACEFDYSGVQACKTLKEEGYTVILVNSNPATIMTDPDFADKTFIEPIDWETIAKIIEDERPNAILPTMGGQTALNCALDLHAKGVLEQYGVEMIGAKPEAIDKAENRQLFQNAMHNIGLDIARGTIARTMEDAWGVLDDIGLPLIIRPSFTLGGTGGGVAYNKEEFEQICHRGLEASPTNELLIEESIIGWKEYEMEVVRDKADNCIIVCSIENFDPMGIHTGDSITVAPAQTLTDKEYQLMRNASISVLREIGVDTGGSNVQFAVNPENGRIIVIEMNPRVSRSSALASKATGFPIAKVAARLAVGYTLDEIQNDITGGRTPASFEPSIDYVVTKLPRFDFEKFPKADSTLTTQMKSVGEVMAIGRTFQESLQKAMRSLEIGSYGFEPKIRLNQTIDMASLKYHLTTPKQDRLWYIADAFRHSMGLDDVSEITHIDPWFLVQIEDIIKTETDITNASLDTIDRETIFGWKQKGFADVRIASLIGSSEEDVRTRRHALGVRPVYKRVDSCAAEFTTSTAYMYSTYDEECESDPQTKAKIVVLGGGPNRIGQGIEFDYCCVHASLAMRKDGYQSIMINCNPETVSTDYDTSDRLYFEPLTFEDVYEVLQKEQPEGVIVQYGGQTPLKLAEPLQRAGVPIIGTSPKAIHHAEDRAFFQQLLQRLNLKQPPNRVAGNTEEALRLAEEIGYPLVVRPSYVLGGRAMEIVHHKAQLESYMDKAVSVLNNSPVLLDRFLNDAIEVDVDAMCDGSEVVIGGIMQHIEEAGVHSGDSACSLPPYSLDDKIQEQIREQTVAMALALNVVGLMNVQFAVKGEDIYVLEVNPRASRTVPFVSKATSILLAQAGARCMVGQSLTSQGITQEVIPPYYSVKEAVFPFAKFPGVDTILGPEMRSTGEAMGVGNTFGEAFGKALRAASMPIPQKASVLISVKDTDKAAAVELCRYFQTQSIPIVATKGTAKALTSAGISVSVVSKVGQERPDIIDLIKDKKVNLIINTTEGRKSLSDSGAIRREALNTQLTYFTTIAGAQAACEAHNYKKSITVNRLQALHQQIKL